MPSRGNRGGPAIILAAALWACAGCSRKDPDPAPVSPVAPAASPVLEELRIVLPKDRPVRAEAPAIFQLESRPPLPANAPCEWIFEASGRTWTVQGRGPLLEYALPTGDTYKVQARVGDRLAPGAEIQSYRVLLVDAADRQLPEGRLALLSRASFDAASKLRDEAVAADPGRVRVHIEDPAPGAPSSVTVTAVRTGATLTLPLIAEKGGRRTRPFVLLSDREDAAAAASALYARPGGRLEMQYRGGPAFAVKMGPSVIHELPVRFVAVGPGLPSTPDLERAVDLRLAQANTVWEPFGRRFTRGPLLRVEALNGLFLIRGRAAGVDGQGHPSRIGVLVDGREISVPAVWRDDGAPMTPKASARAWTAKASKTHLIEQFEDLLAGDREAILLRVRRADGSLAAIEKLAEWNDVAQAAAPLPARAPDGIEIASSPSLLSLEEAALLASAKAVPFEGLDFFIVTGLRSLQTRPAFKVYPDGLFPFTLSGSALVSWAILDESGRYPYGLARVAGEMLLPPGLRPAADDSLFADPPSESAGVEARKRLTSATALKIAERGRGLSVKK